ncbi:hypothetical protein ATANTOWER_014673 [Ataeniobius toweri]|uniref:Uncharacterized protein n=1 Tax=Ataeniobius toweri TaxID=208326 RepID=A0ABU7A224_9TELE|nr:hypothetical protein [Ataeniobius toweri]
MVGGGCLGRRARVQADGPEAVPGRSRVQGTGPEAIPGRPGVQAACPVARPVAVPGRSGDQQAGNVGEGDQQAGDVGADDLTAGGGTRRTHGGAQRRGAETTGTFGGPGVNDFLVLCTFLLTSCRRAQFSNCLS